MRWDGGQRHGTTGVGRFSETMAEEVEEQAQTLSPYALDRATGFYVKVRNVEGL